MDSHDGSETASPESRSVRKLGAVAGINLVGFVLELVGGLVFGSVALLGDAFHMLFDAVAYLIALGATVVARRSEPSARWSYGFHRIEPFAAFLNGVLLVPMVVYLLYEAYQRYLSPVTIDVTMTILLATGGLLINIGSVYVLHGDGMSLNERGAFYHLLGDTGASLAVIVSTITVWATGITFVDPLTAVLIAGLIIWSAWKLLAESGAIFFQQSPVAPHDVREAIENLDGVTQVEDIHIWSLTSRIEIASVFLTDSADSIEERDALIERVHELLETEFDITHSTVEAVNQRHEHVLRT